MRCVWAGCLAVLASNWFVELGAFGPFFSRLAKLAGEASAPDELNRLLGNGEIVVVDCACVGDN